MKKFSVEGTSNASLEAAMASAMSKANLQGAGASSLNISIASATKDDEGNFHVTASVSVIEAGEDNTPSDDDDDEGGGGTGSKGRGRGKPRMTRRAEQISQELKDDLIYQFRVMHLGSEGPKNMADAYKQGLHQVIDATPDVVVYDSMADQTDREDRAAEYADNHENGGKDIVPVGKSNFDVVQEAAPGPSTVTADAGDRISVNVLAREVDEVIGLLSFGFYEPPRPANDPGEQEVVFSGGENDPQQPNPNPAPDPREIPPLPAPDKDQPAPTA